MTDNLLNKNNKESFQIFLEERTIPDPDELLGRAIKYLINKGKTAQLKGFDEKTSPIVEIDEELYKFDKCFGLWQSAKFTKFKGAFSKDNNEKRKKKIEKFYNQKI